MSAATFDRGLCGVGGGTLGGGLSGLLISSPSSAGLNYFDTCSI